LNVEPNLRRKAEAWQAPNVEWRNLWKMCDKIDDRPECGRRHCKNVIKSLHRWEQFLFIARMCSKVTLVLGTALAGIALWSFVESSLAQDALTAPVAASDSDDVDEEETGRKDGKFRRRRSHKTASDLNTNNAPWANANKNRSLAITSVTETAEAEAVVVTGSFDIYPVPYPRCRQLKVRESMPAKKLRS
jgi:hypothetical protein